MGLLVKTGMQCMKPDLWAGVVTLTTEYLLHSMRLNIVLDRPAIEVYILLRHWVGNTTTKDNLDFKIDNDDLQIHPGHPLEVRFYVRYDPINAAPKLRAIRLNGKVICNAEPESPEDDSSLVYSKLGNDSEGVFSPASTRDKCGVVTGSNESVPLINKGYYERGDIPWLVALYRAVESNLVFCAGTLVSDRHVVTDDILVLTLDKRVKFNRYIRPACLWSGDTELSRVVGASGVVAGWGVRSAEDIQGKLDEPQMVRVPIVSTEECRASNSDFHLVTSNTTLCAGDRNGAGPCTGASGGGLYLLDDGKWRLRGVVSLSLRNVTTCNLNEYVVYTDTAQFLPWIRNVLSQKYYEL